MTEFKVCIQHKSGDSCMVKVDSYTPGEAVDRAIGGWLLSNIHKFTKDITKITVEPA